MQSACLPVCVKLWVKLILKTKLNPWHMVFFHRPSLGLHEAASLIVLQFRNVLVEVQWIRVGKSSSLRHLATCNHLFHRHLHLLTADGVLQRDEDKGCHSSALINLQVYPHLTDAYNSLTGMSLVSSSRAGTCRADRAFLMAPLILATKSGLKDLPGAIFKNKITRSSPSALYWGTQRLSVTSSNASTAARTGEDGQSGGQGDRTMADERQGERRRWEVKRVREHRLERQKRREECWQSSMEKTEQNMTYNFQTKDSDTALLLSIVWTNVEQIITSGQT